MAILNSRTAENLNIHMRLMISWYLNNQSKKIIMFHVKHRRKECTYKGIRSNVSRETFWVK